MYGVGQWLLSSLQTHYIWCQSVCCLDVDANQISLIDAPYTSLCFLDTNGVHRHWALIILVVVSDSLTMCDSCSVQAPWKWIILVYFLKEGWWLLCTGSLDTDGICISKVPALDTEDIGCVQGFMWLSPFDTEGRCQWILSAWCPLFGQRWYWLFEQHAGVGVPEPFGHAWCQWMVSDLTDEGCLPL